jgi:hypothetical protein
LLPSQTPLASEYPCKTWGSHHGVTEVSSLLGCYAVSTSI